MGWLVKEPLNNQYVNWIGDIYKGDAFERKWREHFFWHPYTTTQIESLTFLCLKLLKDMSIKNQFIGHNTRINGVERYDGIVSRSNFNSRYTDISPAFDFEFFLKNIENEQHS